MNDHNSIVREYFRNKAAEYDDVDEQLYWVLSDRFYKEVLKREVPSRLPAGTVNLLDAGAGTGRWTMFFHELFNEAYDLKGTLVDLSPEMLEEARKKLAKKSLTSAFECKVGDVEDLSALNESFYDISLSFYNVLSFVYSPEMALRSIHRVLRDGGTHIAVVANTYHAYYFTILTNRLEQLESTLRDSTIRFNEQMPPIHCFTPEELKNLYLGAGFKEVEVLGGPSFIYPGMEETFLHGQTDLLKERLGNRNALDTILDLELKHYRDPGIASRANTLFVIGRK